MEKLVMKIDVISFSPKILSFEEQTDVAGRTPRQCDKLEKFANKCTIGKTLEFCMEKGYLTFFE